MAVTSRPLTAHDRASPRAPRRRKMLAPITILAYGLALLALAVLVQTALTWVQRRLDDLRYGFPRTVSLNAFVGHGDDQGFPTHIEALNLAGQIIIVEFPGGNVSHITALPASQLVGRDAAYVVPQLALRDLNGDGHVELLLTLRGETVVYLNRDGTFQLAAPAELAQLR